MDIEVARLFAAVLALLPVYGVAISLGRIFVSYNEFVGRNPAAEEALDKKFFLSFALTEALAIFSLLISILILFVV